MRSTSSLILETLSTACLHAVFEHYGDSEVGKPSLGEEIIVLACRVLVEICIRFFALGFIFCKDAIQTIDAVVVLLSLVVTLVESALSDQVGSSGAQAKTHSRGGDHGRVASAFWF